MADMSGQKKWIEYEKFSLARFVLLDNRVRRLIGLSESFADASNSLSSAESSKIDTNVSA
jgi:hypothetical protein